MRGPRQFLGYQNEALDDDAFVDGSWFRTGDQGRLDADGHLTITDRVKDIIIRGGENISAREVEDVLAEHAAIDEVAVCAAPDDTWGEVVCAVVTRATRRIGRPRASSARSLPTPASPRTSCRPASSSSTTSPAPPPARSANATSAPCSDSARHSRLRRDPVSNATNVE